MKTPVFATVPDIVIPPMRVRAGPVAIERAVKLGQGSIVIMINGRPYMAVHRHLTGKQLNDADLLRLVKLGLISRTAVTKWKTQRKAEEDRRRVINAWNYVETYARILGIKLTKEQQASIKRQTEK